MSSLLSIIKKILTGGNDTRSSSSTSAAVTPKKMPAVVLRNGDAMWHLTSARKAEQQGDYLSARMGYLKCVETLKQAGDNDDLTEATREYENFVRRDPVFKKLLSVLLPFIEENQGIMQSEITKKFVSVDWSALYRYDRPVTREDIYYALYFADKLGHIQRTKKGRSYELRASSQSPMRSILPIALVSALFFAGPAHALNWTMFTPATTGMGKATCDPADLSACEVPTLCEESGWYWYNGQCNQAKHPNLLKIEAMAGSWRFEYDYLWPHQDYYWFDKATIYEPWPGHPTNTYGIVGINEQGSEVRAQCTTNTVNYYPYTIACAILEPIFPPDEYSPIVFTNYFLFDFITANELAGTYRNLQHPGWETEWYPLRAYRVH